MRSFFGNAVAELADEIAFLDRFGQWLAWKPWATAGYRPTGRGKGLMVSMSEVRRRLEATYKKKQNQIYKISYISMRY